MNWIVKNKIYPNTAVKSPNILLLAHVRKIRQPLVPPTWVPDHLLYWSERPELRTGCRAQGEGRLEQQWWWRSMVIQTTAATKRINTHSGTIKNNRFPNLITSIDFLIQDMLNRELRVEKGDRTFDWRKETILPLPYLYYFSLSMLHPISGVWRRPAKADLDKAWWRDILQHGQAHTGCRENAKMKPTQLKLHITWALPKSHDLQKWDPTQPFRFHMKTKRYSLIPRDCFTAESKQIHSTAWKQVWSNDGKENERGGPSRPTNTDVNSCNIT